MRKLRWLVLLLVFVLIAAACGGDDDDTGGTDTTAAPSETGEPGDQSLEGTEVSIFGAFTSVEADAVNQVIEEKFNAVTGANAVYEGSDSFEEQIKIRVEGGNPPDLAIYPQPGAVVQQAEQGNALALEDLGFDIDQLKSIFGEYLIELGAYEGKHYGIPTNVNLKSLVWYNIPAFDAAGYTIPTTWDEMIALSDQIVADGGTPWCIGTGSDAATGWPATDWMEDIMLRTAGPEVYDQWVSHEIPFNDASVQRAGELFGEVIFTDGYVLGGADQIPAIDFRDAPDPMFNDPPACYLHRQASFIVNFFPEGVVPGEDAGVFAFPTIDEGQTGALIAGELAAVFNDRPEVRAFIENFISADTQCAQGGVPGVQRISPNVEVPTSCYQDPIVATSATAIQEALLAGGARFDASDLMPTEVGSGSFWTGMNEWMRGAPLDEVLQNIENSWPSS